jgi:hypothetical protein
VQQLLFMISALEKEQLCHRSFSTWERASKHLFFVTLCMDDVDLFAVVNTSMEIDVDIDVHEN